MNLMQFKIKVILYTLVDDEFFRKLTYMLYLRYVREDEVEDILKEVYLG